MPGTGKWEVEYGCDCAAQNENENEVEGAYESHIHVCFFCNSELALGLRYLTGKCIACSFCSGISSR